MVGIPDISFEVAELSKFAYSLEEYHYVAIKIVVRCLRQGREKIIIWWRGKPKMTLPVRSFIPKIDMETQLPGAINQGVAVA